MRHVNRLLALALSASLLVSAAPAYGVSTKVITSVSFSDANNGLMAGGVGQTSGFVSRTTDGGQTWTAIERPSKVFSVSAIPNLAFAGTFAFPTVSQSINGGTSWSNASLDSDGVSVDAVAAKPGGGAYAVGSDQMTPGFGTLANVWSLSGDTWTRVFEAPKRYDSDGAAIPTDARLVDVGVAADGTAWVVGTERNTAVGDGSTPTFKDALVFKSTNGSTWTTQTVPYPANNTAYQLSSVEVVSNTTALIGGTTSYLYKTTNGGTNWTYPIGGMLPLDATNTKAVDIRDVASPDGVKIVVVGTEVAPSTKGMISYTPAFGTTKFVTKQTPYPMNSVEFIDANTVTAVGEEEQVYRSTDGGANWTAVSAAPAAPEATITAPIANSVIVDGSAPITGTGFDKGVGVKKVEVSIVRADGQYYNPADADDWQAAALWHTPSTSNGYTTWSLPFTAAQSDLVYTVTTKTTDGLGQTTTKSVTTNDTQRQTPVMTMTTASKTVPFVSNTTPNPATVAGTLKFGSTGIVGGTVVLEKSSSAAGTYTEVARKNTTTGGAVSFSIDVPAYAYYRLRFIGNTSYRPDDSAAITLNPKVKLSTTPWATYGSSTASVSTFYKSRTYDWRSTIWPKHSAPLEGTTFQIYKKNSAGSYKPYKTLTAAIDSKYSSAYSSRALARYRIATAGKYAIRTYHNDAGHAPTYSSWKYFTVK